MRNDIQGSILAPAYLSRLILARYGSNPYGEPLYRLVWGPSRLERSGGWWTDWDGDRVARRVYELRWAPKYPGEKAWLIEKWWPAWCYGGPEQWGAPSEAGGTKIAGPGGAMLALGPYPARGDYEDIGARMSWRPTERHVTLAIDAVENRLAQAPTNPAARVRERVRLAEAEEERREKEFDRFAADVLGEGDQAFHGAPMIGYGGTHRHSSVELCERLGIREHPF